MRADGTVKVLDFGLAKAMDPPSPEATAGKPADPWPTMTSPAMTQMGMILGTAAYMAPEQARGKAVDKRADIWAFGAVLFEMLSGTRPFDGEDLAETMGAVIHKEPDWARLPAATPPSISAVLRRCLQKDPKQRLRDIGDVRLALDGAFETAAPDTGAAATVAIRRPLWMRALPVTLAVVLTAALASAVVWTLRPPPLSLAVTRSSFYLPDGHQFTNSGRNSVAISPDGSRLVYVANRRLYIRSLSEFEATPIPGSENFQAVHSPVFSPNGQSVAFYAFTESAIKKIAITGGSAVTICPASSLFGMSWGPDGVVFGEHSVGIMRVSSDGGTPEPIVRTKEGETAYGPELLPGGTHVLFTLVAGSAIDRWNKAAIVVQSLASHERKVIVAGGSDGRYLPTGHLVYAVGGTLFAVTFEARRLVAHGGAVPVVEGVGRAFSGTTGTAHFSVSRTGSLIYMSGPASTSASSQVQVALIDRKGAIELLPIPAGSYQTPRVSPNGNQIVLATAVGAESFLSVADLTGGTAMRRLTFGGNSRAPIWSRDSQRVAFQSDRDGDLAIFWQRADGTGSAERLTKPDAGTAHVPESWSAKDETLVFSTLRGNVGTLSMFSRERRESAPVGGTRSAGLPGAALSPDGRWLAYTSYEKGLRAVNVEPFPPTGAKYQLSPRSGVSPRHPLWSADGKELVYTGNAGELEVVSVTTQPTFSFGNPVAMPRLFRNSSAGSLADWDIAPDGKFLGLVTLGSVASGAPVKPEIRIVINWHEELMSRVSRK